MHGGARALDNSHEIVEFRTDPAAKMKTWLILNGPRALLNV